MNKLYKVIVGNQSIHGGKFTWDLPHEGNPGAWHKETKVELCHKGFHLTTEPKHWWKEGATVYEVQAVGVVGECTKDNQYKCVAKEVRLLRALSNKELAALCIFVDGVHEVKGDTFCIASGNSTVEAMGNSTVRAYDRSTVSAWDASSINGKVS